MDSPRILFMGTPDFAATQLEYLAKNGYNITGVVCRPDSAKNRGMKLSFPPVKTVATELLPNVPVYQPTTFKDGAGQYILDETAPDIILVVAYGRILPKYVLDYPKYGCVNLHGSILPRYRGAAPIQRAIMNGDRTTGLSLMFLADGEVDSGDVVDIVETEILPDETYGQLSQRLADLGAEFFARGVDRIISGDFTRTPQDAGLVTHAAMIEKTEARLDFSAPAEAVYNTFRAVSPNPGATTLRNGKQLKINAMKLFSGEVPDLAPGTVFFPTKKTAAIACGRGAVELLRAAPEGKKDTAVTDLINGRGIAPGDILG